MALTKLIYSDANEALVQAAEACGQPMTSLINYERGVKSASSNLVSKDLLEQYRPTDDHTACIHLIAMGDSETYGYNRNGDAFPRAALEKNASTFVTNGHVFLEHANKDPEKRLGLIKWAGYDPSPDGMHRVELIIHLDKDRAGEHYEMAKKGSALNFSMSCRVPNDRCSCCGNKARTTGDYCDCLKYSMGKWMDKSASYAFAYNDEPTFFDISIVKHPADRIARHLEYSFQKAASAVHGTLSGAQLAAAEGINLAALELDELSVMRKIAAAEEYVAGIGVANDNRSYACQSAYPNAMQASFTKDELDSVRSANPGTFFNAMAKRACVMSFPAFCQYITGNVDAADTPMAKKAAMMLPGIFGDILGHLGCITPLTGEFAAASDRTCCCDAGGDEIQRIMDQMEEKFSMEPGKVSDRVITITITCGAPGSVEVKSAFAKAAACVDGGQALALAEAYAQYQARALCDIMEKCGSAKVEGRVIDIVAAANTAVVYNNN